VRVFEMRVKWLLKDVKPPKGSRKPARRFNGAQGTHTSTWVHRLAHRFGSEHKRWEVRVECTEKEKGGRRSWGCSPESKEGGAELRRTSPKQGRWSLPPMEKSRQELRATDKNALASGSGREEFLKTLHGHTRQFTVHVWCTPDSTQ
jgi:hypothetical protein